MGDASWWMVFTALLVMIHAWWSACKRADMWRDASYGTLEQLVNLATGINRYGLLLDKTVWVKKFEASDWEEATVVAVSRHGSIAFRRTSNPTEKAYWLDKRFFDERVRTEKPE